jgi:hypothetical protein
MAEVGRILDCAADGRGCVLVITGPPGSGRTELAAAAAREGARRGFSVLRTAAMPGEPGALAWARLLADAGAPDELASRVLDDAGPLALDTAARALSNGNRRLLVIDDIDHGGAAALRLLETRVSSFTAAPTSCSATEAKPANRPPLAATSAARKSLIRGAVLTARTGSVIPSVPPMVWDKIEMSMPAASISSIRPSRRSFIRAFTAFAYSGVKPPTVTRPAGATPAGQRPRQTRRRSQ